jgi:hypothetical protein
MALTKISTAMISQSAAAVDLNVDAGTFYVDTTNNRVGVGGKTDPDTPLHVIGTVTATLFAGSGASLTSIPNSALVNSSITINSTAVSLGGSLTLTTANIGENTNLYYTDARADARIAAADTDDLSEGSSNLYYTDARVDARVSGGSLGNITTTGYIRGPATFTIDPAAHGDNTGTVVIAGNLQVDGTTTTINSTTLTVDDKNITLASGSANAAAADGAGFTVDIGTGTNPAITYDGTNDEWDFNKPLNVTGNIAVSGTVDGVDIAARDAILTSTTTTAGAALPLAGGTLTGALTLQSAGVVTLKAAPLGSTYGGGFNAITVTGSSGSPYTSTIGFSNYGVTDAMVIKGGNVGIGTASPNSWASYTDSAATVLQVEDSSQRARIVINGGNGAHLDLVDYAGGTNDKHMNIAVDGGILKFGSLNDAGSAWVKDNIMVMDLGSGNVGIGTASPTYKLDGGFANQTWGWYLNSSYNAGFTYNTTERSIEIFTKSADNADHIKFSTGGSGPTERMRIDSLGNVLFGNGNSHSPKIQGTTNSGRTPGSPGYSFNDDLNTGMFQPLSTPDTIAFSTGGAERMRITTDGTVGIGATSGHANLVVRDRVDGTHKGGRIGFGIHEAGALQIYDAVTMSKTAGSVVTDSTASGGENVTLSSGQLYGPYHTLPRGSYRLCVKMKTTNAAYTGDAARLTCHVSSGTVVPESRTVRGVDFGTNNKWQSFSVPFQVVGAATNAVEFYLFALNSQAISVDYFFIMNDTDSYSTRVYGNQTVDGKVGIGISAPTHGLTVSDLNGGDDADMRRITIKSETHGVNSGFRFDSESANGTARAGGYYFVPGDTDATTYLGLSATDTNYQMAVTRGGKVGIGTTNPFSSLQSGNNTFSGTHGMYADARVGISNHGELTGMMLASTYNDAAHPEYGLVFVQGPSTSSYNVWSISPDGPAKGNGLNFHYGAGVTNIHSPSYAKVTFKGDGKVGIGTASPGEKLEVNGILQIKRAGDHPAIRFVEDTTTRAYIGSGDWAINGLADSDFGISSVGALALGHSAGAERMRIHTNGNVGIGTTGPTALLEIASGAPTLILNANTQATNKKKVRIAVSQHTAGDFNIQQMNDDGTTIAQQALTITNAGDIAVGGTGAPNAPTQKQNTTITSSNSLTGTWTSPAAGGTYNARNSIEVGGILNRHIGKWGFSGNFSANTWYPFVKRSELTSMYRAASGSEDGFTLYFRIYLYPTTSGIGEYFSNRMSEMVYIQSSGSNSVTWHELRIGAGWGHAPNAGTDFDPDGRFSGFGPVRLRIQHHLGTDSNFPSEQTIDINFASAVTGLNPSVAGRQVLIYGYML